MCTENSPFPGWFTWMCHLGTLSRQTATVWWIGRYCYASQSRQCTQAQDRSVGIGFPIHGFVSKSGRFAIHHFEGLRVNVWSGLPCLRHSPVGLLSLLLLLLLLVVVVVVRWFWLSLWSSSSSSPNKNHSWDLIAPSFPDGPQPDFGFTDLAVDAKKKLWTFSPGIGGFITKSWPKKKFARLLHIGAGGFDLKWIYRKMSKQLPHQDMPSTNPRKRTWQKWDPWGWRLGKISSPRNPWWSEKVHRGPVQNWWLMDINQR